MRLVFSRCDFTRAMFYFGNKFLAWPGLECEKVENFIYRCEHFRYQTIVSGYIYKYYKIDKPCPLSLLLFNTLPLLITKQLS